MINFKLFLRISLIILFFNCANTYSQTLYSFTKDSKKGLVDNKMKVIIEPKYDNIGTLNMWYGERYKEKDYLIFKSNKKYGIIDLKEKIILEPKYDRLYPTDLKNTFSFTRNDIGGLVNLKGEEFFAESNSNYNITNNNKSIIKSKKIQNYWIYSILNKNGSIVREFGKDTLVFSSNYNDFKSDIFIYKVKQKVGFVDAKGVLRTKAIFNKATGFKKKYAIIENKDKKSDFFLTSRLINKQGEFVNNIRYKDVKFKKSITGYGGQESNENLYYFRIDDKVGLFDENLNVIIEPKYTQIGKFNEGLAFVSNTKGKYGFINNLGKEIIPLIYDNADFFSENLAPVVKDGKWGFIDKENNIIIDFKFIGNVKPFSDGLAQYRKNKKTSKSNSNIDLIGFINKKGDITIDNIYYEAENFKEGVSVVAFEGFYYLIDKKGKRFKLFKDKEYHKEVILKSVEIEGN